MRLPENKRCTFVKSDGQRCRASALTNEQFCFTHHPQKDAERKAARSKGGKAKSRSRMTRLPLLDLEPLTLNTVQDVRQALADTFNRVRCGQMDVKVGNCLTYVASNLARVIEGSDLEKRIEELELLVDKERNRSVLAFQATA